VAETLMTDDRAPPMSPQLTWPAARAPGSSSSSRGGGGGGGGTWVGECVIDETTGRIDRQTDRRTSVVPDTRTDTEQLTTTTGR